MAIALFCLGLLVHVVFSFISVASNGQDKIGISIAGIGLMIAAAVVKYLAIPA